VALSSRRQRLFVQALERANAEAQRAPGVPLFQSIKNQLEYLVDLDAGRRTDRERLAEIILGIQAARDLGGRDELTDLLFQVMDEVAVMRNGG
jgi:hypothetical protein